MTFIGEVPWALPSTGIRAQQPSVKGPPIYPFEGLSHDSYTAPHLLCGIRTLTSGEKRDKDH